MKMDKKYSSAMKIFKDSRRWKIDCGNFIDKRLPRKC
jgi:hypothetical protein